jgi:hypothetical protein
MDTAKILLSAEQFLMNSSLYEIYEIKDDTILKNFYQGNAPNFDGFCPSCKKETTFKISDRPSFDAHWNHIWNHVGFGNIEVTCTRNDNHTIHFYFYLSKMKIQKVGQFPSIADIAFGGTKIYRNQMSKENSQEFYKAIGLATHGVGVGSFVYLRRIFEKLIDSRFQEYKTKNSWSENDFLKKRMDEKITFLKDYLPSFLAENPKLYSILSIGIHELDEQRCLAFFEVLKDSIILILDEDKKKKEELILRQKLKSSIDSFQSKDT